MTPEGHRPAAAPEQAIITWESIAPLFEDGWRGEKEAWRVFEEIEPLVGRITTSKWRRAAMGKAGFGASHRHASIEELVNDLLTHLMKRLRDRGGLKRPHTISNEADATGWLATWLRSRCSDVMRKGWRSETRETSLVVDLPTAQTDPWSRPDALSQLDKLRTAIEGGELPPDHALATLCLHAPELIEQEDVDRAVDKNPKSLVRGATETWIRLVQWRRAVVDPAGNDSRRDLAWILFSKDQESPEAWRQRDPDEVKRKRNLLQTWDKRFIIAAALFLRAGEDS